MEIRSFLAFDLSEKVKQELSSLVQLLSAKSKGVKWIKPDLMHCTVKFFGNVDEELLLGNISSVLEDTLKNYPPFHLKGIGVGVFPNWRYPRVIWAGLVGDVETAIDLHERIENVLRPFNLKKDEREFRLHLTLGRAKSPLKGSEGLIALLEKMADKEFGEFDVDHLTLYKSVLTRDGPIYTPLREFKLGGK
jgi:2'-5' RNA ligase